jgi:hypothetical protein
VAGRGIGAQLIAAAGDLTRACGRRWLRLDCDRDNERLRAYYEGLGFAHAGDVDCLPRTTRPGYRAASRYQRAIGPSGNTRLVLLVGVTGQAARRGHRGRPEIVRAPG